jgi:hypothetical protein
VVAPLLVNAIFVNIGRVILPVTALVTVVLGSPLLIAVTAHQPILGVGKVFSAVIIIPAAPPAVWFRADALIRMKSRR